MAYSSFEDLEVWKRACKLAVQMYDVLKKCRKELVEVLEERLILKLRDGDTIPTVKDIDINIKEAVST